jgi:DNA replication protein DnaD
MIKKEKKIPRENIPAILAGRWGFTILEKEGWTTIPNLLLYNQKKIDLSNTELLLLIHLISFIHYGDMPAFPAISTLAERINQHPRTVQRTLNNLLKRKIITRKIRSKSIGDKGLSNIYGIEPLIEILASLKEENLSDKDLF